MHTWDGNRCEKLEYMEIEATIKKFMDSIGEDDYESEHIKNPKTGKYEEVTGEDYEKLCKLREEWDDKIDEIEEEHYERKKAILNTDF